MDFEVTHRKADKGQFAVLSRDGRPVAQLFVPSDPPVAEQFSFFWCGRAKRGVVHELLIELFGSESEVSMRLVGRASVTTFGYSPTGEADIHAAQLNVDFAHHIIHDAGLPYSLGLTFSAPGTDNWPSQVYIWALIAEEESEGRPEVGVRTTLADWRKPVFRKAVFPLFRNTIEVEGVEDLWAQAVEIAAKLMH
jgi:hypothetical protein